MRWIKNKIKEKSFFLTNTIYQYYLPVHNCSVSEEHYFDIWRALMKQQWERSPPSQKPTLKLSIRPGRGLPWNPPEANEASFLNRVCYSFMYVLLWECIRTTRMLLICAHMCSYVLECNSYVLVCYSYVLVCYSYVLVWTRTLLVCTRKLLMYSYVTRMS